MTSLEADQKVLRVTGSNKHLGDERNLAIRLVNGTLWMNYFFGDRILELFQTVTS